VPSAVCTGCRKVNTGCRVSKCVPLFELWPPTFRALLGREGYLICNQQVIGSSPIAGSICHRHPQWKHCSAEFVPPPPFTLLPLTGHDARLATRDSPECARAFTQISATATAIRRLRISGRALRRVLRLRRFHALQRLTRVLLRRTRAPQQRVRAPASPGPSRQNRRQPPRQ